MVGKSHFCSEIRSQKSFGKVSLRERVVVPVVCVRVIWDRVAPINGLTWVCGRLGCMTAFANWESLIYVKPEAKD